MMIWFESGYSFAKGAYNAGSMKIANVDLDLRCKSVQSGRNARVEMINGTYVEFNARYAQGAL